MADLGTFSTAAEAVSKATCSAFKNILEYKQKTFNVLEFYFIFGFWYFVTIVRKKCSGDLLNFDLQNF